MIVTKHDVILTEWFQWLEQAEDESESDDE